MSKLPKLPQYKQIYEDLRAQITGGVYAPGDRLPSEYDLSVKYDVARLTLRKAIEQLASDEIIVRHQGKRSVVKGTPRGIGILSLMSTTTALDSTNLTTRITMKPELRSWNEAFTFSVEPHEEAAGCIYFERLRLIDETPVFYDITMLPNINLPHFLNYDMENKSLFDTLRAKYQIVVTGGIQQIFAIRADQRLQKSFNISAGHPVLQLNRKIDTSRPGFHIYSQIFCVTQRYGLTGTF
ncbi:MAG: GntR family transcriptional regulator [Tannerella sp.]|jgi:DNA-binding GntR family transcriptional regulator|nr:GntR family transcriptional regulator [Tannerella sp.]